MLGPARTRLHTFSEAKALAAQLQRAREDERRHLARELHDDLAQGLAALCMDISALRSGLRDESSSDARALVASLDRRSADAVKAARRLVAGLRPPNLQQHGLLGALGELCIDTHRRSGLACRMEGDKRTGPIDRDVSLALYRCAQEAMNNVVRHAQATQAYIQLTQVGGAIHLRVVDDGKGFSQHESGRNDAFGLIGMRERAHVLGGSLMINSAPGNGTHIDVRIPAMQQRN